MSIQEIITEPGTFDFSTKNVEQLTIKGNNIIVKGLKMINVKNKAIQILGNNNTLLNCKFSGNEDGEQFIQVKGQNNRISGCLFENFEKIGCIICVNLTKSKPSYCLIDNNNFRECLTTFDNGAEVIRIGDSKTSMYDGACIVYNNFFSRCNREIEMISVKSCKNIIAYNKVMECKSGICLRHGNNNVVMYNYINGNHIENCCGIRIIGENHIVKYNTIEGIVNKGNPFRSALVVMNGEEKPKPNGYFTVLNSYIGYNSILSCDVALSFGVDNKRSKQTYPEKNIIEFNKIVKCLEFLDTDPKTNKPNSNNVLTSNQMINKDVKIEIIKAKDLTDHPNLIIDLYEELLQDRKVEQEEEKKDDIKHPEVNDGVDLSGLKIDDVLEKIDDILHQNDNANTCSQCDNYVAVINSQDKHHKEQMKSLKEELEKYKMFYEKVVNKLY